MFTPVLSQPKTSRLGSAKLASFLLSRAAVDTTQVVRVLPSANTIQRSCYSATPSITPATHSATQSSAHATLTSSSQPTNISATTQTLCLTCNRMALKNYLVAAGVIPESLANALMSPALERKEKVRLRGPLPARVITSDEDFDLLV
ncbi:hypothetical protein ROHU_003179 [Labeo rohita]|uniref:Uncharacterized protein n=1 Tax=Labeo rohita TaxID=84645 RepID=A0A498MP14_LABRO|nr:hypothetical protein ROHU_007634 [Labeo rohita]RXN36183.1 hypothetical protein ROHU_003179 [Labeo rohita]